MTATRSTWRHLAIIFTVATILSLCPTVVQGDDTCSCASDADGGCVPYPVPVCPGNNCNKVNVAYGKQANMSSKHYAHTPHGSNPACAAVNGRAGHTMIRNATGRNCVHTLPFEPISYWQVDLGQSFTVSEVIVYSKLNQIERLVGLDILVDSQTCKRLPDSEGYIRANYQMTSTIPCDSPVTGQVVKFYKYNIMFRRSFLKIINFCEVQIWVCKPGLYGKDCDKVCHCLNNATCDNYFGTCPNGCMDGYYGTDCSGQCGQCKNNAACDKTTGQCPGELCEAGYQPPLCKETCTNNTYGDNCSLKCGRCQSAAACDVFNGECLACEGNFAAPLCKECNHGYHGGQCSEGCGQCKDNAACDRDTGRCAGGCNVGYQPPDCKDNCDGNMYGDNCAETCGRCENSAKCDVISGSCHACEDRFSLPLCKKCKNGYHGNDCINSCGRCLEDGCDKSTGSCSLRGCQPGFEPPFCTSETPDYALVGGAAGAGLVVGLVVGAVAAVAACVVISRRRKHRPRRSPPGISEVVTDHQLEVLPSNVTGAAPRPRPSDQHIYANTSAASQPPARSLPLASPPAAAQRSGAAAAPPPTQTEESVYEVCAEREDPGNGPVSDASRTPEASDKHIYNGMEDSDTHVYSELGAPK